MSQQQQQEQSSSGWHAAVELADDDNDDPDDACMQAPRPHPRLSFPFLYPVPEQELTPPCEQRTEEDEDVPAAHGTLLLPELAPPLPCCSSPSSALSNQPAVLVSMPSLTPSPPRQRRDEAGNGPGLHWDMSETPRAPFRHRRGRKSIAYGVLTHDARVVADAIAAGDDPNMEIWDMDGTAAAIQVLPLLAAAERGDADVVQTLLEGGAVAAAVNGLGQTALHLLVLGPAQPDCCCCCGRRDLDTQPFDHDHDCTTGRPQTWTELKKYLDDLPIAMTDIDPNQTWVHETPAAIRRHRDMLQPASSADGGATMKTGAREWGVLLAQTASLLIQYGADPTRRDVFGKTASDYVLDVRYPATIMELLTSAMLTAPLLHQPGASHHVAPAPRNHNGMVLPSFPVLDPQHQTAPCGVPRQATDTHHGVYAKRFRELLFPSS